MGAAELVAFPDALEMLASEAGARESLTCAVSLQVPPVCHGFLCIPGQSAESPQDTRKRPSGSSAHQQRNAWSGRCLRLRRNAGSARRHSASTCSGEIRYVTDLAKMRVGRGPALRSRALGFSRSIHQAKDEVRFNLRKNLSTLIVPRGASWSSKAGPEILNCWPSSTGQWQKVLEPLGGAL